MEPKELDLSSASITDQQKAKPIPLFPKAVTESGKIDFEHLKVTLPPSGTSA